MSSAGLTRWEGGVRRAGVVALAAAVVAAALGIAAACTPDDDGDVAISDTAFGATEPRQSLTMALTDENVIALLDTTYDAMIELGGLAAAKAGDARVRETIRETITLHRQMRSENLALAREIDARPKLVRGELIAGHHAAMERLRMQRGGQFDRDYLDHVIGMHEALLSGLREALAAPAQEPVRSHLERVAATVEQDLTRARELRSEMRAG